MCIIRKPVYLSFAVFTSMARAKIKLNEGNVKTKLRNTPLMIEHYFDGLFCAAKRVGLDLIHDKNSPLTLLCPKCFSNF